MKNIAKHFSRTSVTVSLLMLGAAEPTLAHEGELVATVARVTANGPAEEVGKIYFRDTPYGLLVAPDLKGLSPGPHGTHLHEFANCAAHTGGAAAGAGDHYDPKKTRRHAGPYEEGHLGDLPNLWSEADGSVRVPVIAPRLKTSDLEGLALIIHAGVDRYNASSADSHPTHKMSSSHSSAHEGHEMPAPVTGGERMYCGLVKPLQP